MILSTIIVVSFVLQVYCYWRLGRGQIPYVVQMFVLLGYFATEAYWAVHGNPLMWLYCVLNVWGMYNMLLAWRRAKCL